MEITRFQLISVKNRVANASVNFKTTKWLCGWIYWSSDVYIETSNDEKTVLGLARNVRDDKSYPVDINEDLKIRFNNSIKNMSNKSLKEGCKVAFPELKHCWIAHDNGKYKYQRYLIENKEDLDLFLGHDNFEHWTKVKRLFLGNLESYLLEGRKIILSDNTMSGFPSYHTNRGTNILEIIK